MTDPTERLDKRLARQLGCPRGQARQWIENGWVRVQGVVVEQPQHPVSAVQPVSVDEHADDAKAALATMVFHKPAGMAPEDVVAAVTPASQRADDPSGVRRLQRHFHQLRSVLPLATAASGLVIVGQDGRVLSHLAHAGRELEQEYLAAVDGEHGTWTLGRLQAGLRGGQAVKVSWQSEQRLRIAGKGIDGGMIAQACAGAGLQLTGLRRLRIGRVGLAKLPAGQWHYLAEGTRF